MIIRALIYLCTKFAYVNTFCEDLTIAFLKQAKANEVNSEKHKQLMEEKCKQNLYEVTTFAKLGEKSGYAAPKIYKKG